MKKLFALILALVMCIGLFAGCQKAPEPTEAPTSAPTEAPKETEAPTMAPETAAPTDPEAPDANVEGWLNMGSMTEKFGYNNSDYGGYIKNFMWSRLLMIDGQGVVIGTDLAESYEISDDSLTWTIKIKDNAVWHDGTPVTADDVKFTIEACAKGAQVNSVFAGAFAAIEGYDACKAGEATEVTGLIADGKTITIKCTKPSSTMGLTLGQFNINPKHLLGNEDPLTLHDSAYWIEPIGSGFYKVGEYVEGKYWKLVPNEDFYDADRIPKIQQLYVGYSAGGTTTDDPLLSCQSGKTHLTGSNNPDFITEVAKLENYSVIPSEIYYIRYLMWNSHGQQGSFEDESPLKDLRLRQACMYAIDRQSIADDMFLGYATVIDAKVPSSFSYAAEDAVKYEYDVEKAKALIADAGFDTTTHLKLACYYSDQQSKDVCEAAVYYLNEAGFDFELVFITGDAVQGIYETKDYDLCYAGLSAMGPEEAYGAFCNLDQTMLMGKVRPILHGDDNKFEGLYNELLITTDADRRTELLKELQKAEADYLWDLPLVAVSYCHIVRNDLLHVGTMQNGNAWFNYDRDVETWTLLKIEDPTA